MTEIIPEIINCTRAYTFFFCPTWMLMGLNVTDFVFNCGRIYKLKFWKHEENV